MEEGTPCQYNSFFVVSFFKSKAGSLNHPLQILFSSICSLVPSLSLHGLWIWSCLMLFKLSQLEWHGKLGSGHFLATSFLLVHMSCSPLIIGISGHVSFLVGKVAIQWLLSGGLGGLGKNVQQWGESVEMCRLLCLIERMCKGLQVRSCVGLRKCSKIVHPRLVEKQFESYLSSKHRPCPRSFKTQFFVWNCLHIYSYFQCLMIFKNFYISIENARENGAGA